MKVLKALTVFIIILIFFIVKIYAQRKNGGINFIIRGTPRCFQPFGPDLSFISDKENVSAVIGDVTHPHPFLNVTGKCNQQITITGNLPDDLQEKKKRYYVGYYYSYELTLIVKKFPEDCKQKYERQSPYNCDFEELNPNKKKGMTDEEFGRYLHDIFGPMKLFGG